MRCMVCVSSGTDANALQSNRLCVGWRGAEGKGAACARVSACAAGGVGGGGGAQAVLALHCPWAGGFCILFGMVSLPVEHTLHAQEHDAVHTYWQTPLRQLSSQGNGFELASCGVVACQMCVRMGAVSGGPAHT